MPEYREHMPPIDDPTLACSLLKQICKTLNIK